MEIQKNNQESNQQVVKSAAKTLPQRLQTTLGILANPKATPNLRAAANASLMRITGELMPDGKPNFVDLIKYPQVRQLVQKEGFPVVMLAVAQLIRLFCTSYNVQRNMNEQQIIEAADMLVRECGNFRIEDYVMMFALAKRGRLRKEDGKQFTVYERIDITVIAELKECYTADRIADAEQREIAEIENLDALGPSSRTEALLYFDQLARQQDKEYQQFLKQQEKKQQYEQRKNDF